MGRRIRSAYGDQMLPVYSRVGHLSDELEPVEKYSNEFVFYIGEAMIAGALIAEFASGAGRVLIPLAESGVEVYGVEASEEMIGLAKKVISRRSAEVQERIHLIRGDMRRTRLPERVALIIVPYITFWYNFFRNSPYYNFLCSGNERKEKHIQQRKFLHLSLQGEYCLRAIMENLFPGGRFIIDAPQCGNYAEEWWDAMAQKYKFSYGIARPYFCQNCRQRIPWQVSSRDFHVMTGVDEVLIGTKLD